MSLPFAILALSGISALGQLSAGAGAKSVAEANARLYEQQAQLARQTAEEDAAAKSRTLRRRLGEGRAAAGQSGLELSGSVLDVLNDVMLEGLQEVENARFAGKASAAQLEGQAGIQRMVGKQQFRKGVFGALTAIGTGAIGAYQGGLKAPQALQPLNTSSDFYLGLD